MAKNNIWKADNPMKRSSRLLTNREMQIKTITAMALTKKKAITDVAQVVDN